MALASARPSTATSKWVKLTIIMFYALNNLRPNRQKDVKTNFQSLLVLVLLVVLQLAFIRLSSGFPRAVVIGIFVYQSLQLHPLLLNEATPIYIRVYHTSSRDRLVLTGGILLALAHKLIALMSHFTFHFGLSPKYAQIDNLEAGLSAAQVALLLLIWLVGRSEVSLGFHQLKKSTAQILKLIHHVVFLALVVFLFSFYTPQLCLTYNDLGMYYLLNLFAFSKIILGPSSLRAPTKVWLVRTITWGFAVLAFLYLTIDVLWVSHQSFFLSPLFFYLLLRGYFVLLDILGFHENRPEYDFLDQLNTGIERYCVEAGKVDPAAENVTEALAGLKVVVELRRFLYDLEGSEDIDHYVIKFDRRVVQPILDFLSDHRKAFVFTVEVLVNLFIILFAPFQFELDILVTWLYFITSVCFKKKRKNFRRLLLVLYLAMMFYYSLDTFRRMNFASVLQKIQTPHSPMGLNSFTPNEYPMMQYILVTVFVLIQINFYRKSPAKKSTEIEIRQKLTAYLGQGSARHELWSFFWKSLIYLANIVLFYFSVTYMLFELNVLNLIFLALLFRAVYRNSEDFTRIAKLLVIYQTTRVFMVLFYHNALDNVFTVFEELFLGLASFRVVFFERGDKIELIGNSATVRLFLFFNLVVRANYALLLKLRLEFPELPSHPIFARVKVAMNGCIAFVFPCSLMLFIYLTLAEHFVDFYAVVSLNGLIFLLFSAIFTQIKGKNFRVYQMKTARLFRFFMVIYFGVTLFCYVADLTIFYYVGKQPNHAFQEAVQSHLLFRSLRRNAISSKEEWWQKGELPARPTIANEALKAVTVLVTSILLRHWSKFARASAAVKARKGMSRHLLITIIYLLFFVFFAINIAYFLTFQYNYAPIKHLPLFLTAGLLLILNVLIRRFYAIGNLFHFTKIVSQEIAIFKQVFTTGLQERPFKDTLLDHDFWNEKYILLKENYRQSFFGYLRNNLLQKLFLYFRIYFGCFCAYFLLEVNGVAALGRDTLNQRMLAVEMVIIGLSVALIQLMSNAQSEKAKALSGEALERELGYVKLLVECNEMVIRVIKKKAGSDLRERLESLDARLSEFLRLKFDLVLKTYRRDMYQKLKDNRIVLGIESRVYDMQTSKLFVSKALLGTSTYRGQIELKLLKEKEEEEFQNRLGEMLPQFNSFDSEKRVEEGSNLSRGDDGDTDLGRPRESAVFQDSNRSLVVGSQVFQGFRRGDTQGAGMRHSHREASLPRTTVAEWQRIEKQIQDVSQKHQEELRKNIFLAELRQVINQDPQTLYQDVRDRLKNETHTRLKLNESVQKKLRNWPQTNHLALLAILCFSMFDIVKNSIVNLLLLSLTDNINVLTLVSITFMYGLPIVRHVKFTTILAVVSFSFLARAALSVYPELLPNYWIMTLLTTMRFSRSSFMVELLTISSTLFLFIPTFLLMSVVFERFIRIKVPQDFAAQTTHLPKTSDNDLLSHPDTARAFTVSKLVKTKCYDINFFEWNSRKYRLLPALHEYLVEKERFIYPVIFAVLSLHNSKYTLYFCLYVAFQMLRTFLTRLQELHKLPSFFPRGAGADGGRDRDGREAPQGFWFSFRRLMALKSVVFGFLFAVVAVSLYDRSSSPDYYLVVVFVVLNFKIILYDSEFFRHKRETTKKNALIRHELVNFLENMALNDDLIVRKTIGELNYQKYISFHKYSRNSQNLSPARLLQSNLRHFNFVYEGLVDWKTRFVQTATTDLLENCRRFSGENIFLLSLVLAEKYQNLVTPDLNFLEILCGKLDSLVQLCRKIEQVRDGLVGKKASYVARFDKEVERQMADFMTRPQAVDILIPRYEEIRTRTKRRDFVVTGNLDIEKVADGASANLPGDSPNIGEDFRSLSDLLDKTHSSLISNGVFHISQESLAPTYFDFWISKKALVRIHNFKFSHLLNKFERISIEFRSLFAVGCLVLWSYADYFLCAAILWLSIMSYGHLIFPLVAFLIFLVPIEHLPEYRNSRVLGLHVAILALTAIRLWIHLTGKSALWIEFTVGKAAKFREDVLLILFSSWLWISTSRQVNRVIFTRREFSGEACYRVK